MTYLTFIRLNCSHIKATKSFLRSSMCDTIDPEVSIKTHTCKQSTWMAITNHKQHIITIQEHCIMGGNATQIKTDRQTHKLCLTQVKHLLQICDGLHTYNVVTHTCINAIGMCINHYVFCLATVANLSVVKYCNRTNLHSTLSHVYHSNMVKNTPVSFYQVFLLQS